MKKFSAALLALLLLLAVTFAVGAAGSASLTGPTTVRAGDTITLSFKAGGGILGGNGSISFDSSQLTLQGYTASIGGGWKVEFNGNTFVFYNNDDTTLLTGTATIFKATFKVAANLAPGTQVQVSANGITLSDGTADANIGTKTYSVTIAEPLSNNANLKSLTVGNAKLSPGFSANTTGYTTTVPYATAKLELSAEAEHPGAKVKINNPTLPAGGSANVTVTVTAEDGTTKTYTIRATRQQDPNYVPSHVNTLETLEVQGYRLSPAFDPERLHYAVYIPYEEDALMLAATVTDTKSTADFGDYGVPPVGQSVIEVYVTAENKDVRTYTITVFRAEPFGVETEPTEPPTDPPHRATHRTSHGSAYRASHGSTHPGHRAYPAR